MKAFKVIIVAVVILFFIAAGYVIWQNPAGDFGKQPRQPPPAQGAPLVQQATVAPSAPAKSAESQPSLFETNVPEDFTLAGIRVGATSEEVIGLLGQPLRKERQSMPDVYDDESVEWVETWTYDGIEVSLAVEAKAGDPPPAGPGTVDFVSVTSRNFEAQGGVKVGDSYKQVEAAYTTLETDNDSVVWVLSIEYTNGVVTSITLGPWID